MPYFFSPSPQKLEAEEFPIGVGQSVLLIDMYVSAGKLDDALRELAEMQKRNPDVKLTPLKVMKIAQLMLTEGRTDGEFFFFFMYVSLIDLFSCFKCSVSLRYSL